MKIKSMISTSLAVLLLALFLPVFYCTVFIGNNMDYYAEHKIETLLPNTTLLAYGILALFLFALLFFLLNKVPYNKYTIVGTVILSLLMCFGFYLGKVEISKCIAFYGGWDCGMVANSARWLFEGKDIGYGDYYYIFSNNIPITWLLYILYEFSNSMAGYAYNPEFIWIQFQCFMFAAAIFFSAMTILIISRKIAPVILNLLVNIIFLGLCPWQIIPYTDGSTIAIPILVLFLYALFRRVKSGIRYALWFFLFFVGAIGGVIKATCYVAVIAVALVDFMQLILCEEHMISKGKKLALQAVLLAAGFLLAFWCRSGMYKTVDYVPDHNLEMTWTNFFYDGLNETSTGACSGDGLIIARSYAGYSRRFRQSIELHYAKERMLERGFGGMLNFWLRKSVMNFNDGTFSWFQEGYFHAWDYPDITNSSFKESLRKFYWKEGADYKKFTTWSQGIWLFVLNGIILEAAAVMIHSCKKKGEAEALDIRIVGIVIFIGLFLFVMLFEGRARYLMPAAPVLTTMAVLGSCEFARMLCCCVKKFHGGAGALTRS